MIMFGGADCELRVGSCCLTQSTKEKTEEDKEEDKSKETKGEKEEAPTDGDADHTSPQSS